MLTNKQLAQVYISAGLTLLFLLLLFIFWPAAVILYLAAFFPLSGYVIKITIDYELKHNILMDVDSTVILMLIIFLWPVYGLVTLVAGLFIIPVWYLIVFWRE